MIFIDLGAIFAGAVLLSQSFLGRFGWFAWCSLVPLFWATHSKKPSIAFLYGWLFGASAWMMGTHWMFEPMRAYLGIGPFPAACLFTAFGGYYGLMFAAPAGLSRLISPDSSSRAWVWAAVPAFVAAEGFFPMLFPEGFASSQMGHLPTVQIAELLGEAGPAWLIVAFNAALYRALRFGRRGLWGAFAVVSALAFLNEGYGRWRIGRVDAEVAVRLKEHPFKVAVIQGALPLEGPAAEQGLAVYNRLTREALAAGGINLVIWPESIFDSILDYGEAGGRAVDPSVSGVPLGRFLKEHIDHPVAMLLNTHGRLREGPARTRLYNVSFLVGPRREFLGLAEKLRLFPFGEYMPMERLFPFLRRISPRTYRLEPGPAPRILRTPEGLALAALVCYEDLDPALAESYARAGAELLVNLTNDLRFAVGEEPEQHLRLSALRAVETRKFLVRAANTGISAVVDPAGRVVRQIPVGAAGFAAEEVAAMPGLTLHARTGRFFYALAFLPLGILAFIRMRPGRFFQL